MVVSDGHEDRWGMDGSMSNFLALCRVPSPHPLPRNERRSNKCTGINFPPSVNTRRTENADQMELEKKVRNDVTSTFENINRSFYLR